jgi:lipopolysaccharide/colanic/teichoic acid biosynthesis glycosyltransferase
MTQHSTQEPVVHPYYGSFRKRLFDFFISSVWILIASPLFLIISLAIITSSGFPIFFTQKRLGKDKKVFRMYKFRTMYVGAHADTAKFLAQNQAPEPMFKIFDDPRFVGVGRFLSATGLDELPQLINVLLGNMSLVGTRPLPVAQAKKLGCEWQFRFQAKPGIFSEWTISRDRHKSSEKWLELDRKTLSKGSVTGDISIILRTLLKLAR